MDSSSLLDWLMFAESVVAYGDTLLLKGGDGALSLRWVWEAGCFLMGTEVLV